MHAVEHDAAGRHAVAPARCGDVLHRAQRRRIRRASGCCRARRVTTKTVGGLEPPSRAFPARTSPMRSTPGLIRATPGDSVAIGCPDGKRPAVCQRQQRHTGLGLQPLRRPTPRKEQTPDPERCNERRELLYNDGRGRRRQPTATATSRRTCARRPRPRRLPGAGPGPARRPALRAAPLRPRRA